MPLKMHTGKGF